MQPHRVLAGVGVQCDAAAVQQVAIVGRQDVDQYAAPTD
jgi:hypothetical protein